MLALRCQTPASMKHVKLSRVNKNTEYTLLLILQNNSTMDLWKSYFGFYSSIYTAATMHDEAVGE